jgi:hypothetical protein
MLFLAKQGWILFVFGRGEDLDVHAQYTFEFYNITQDGSSSWFKIKTNLFDLVHQIALQSIETENRLTEYLFNHFNWFVVLINTS